MGKKCPDDWPFYRSMNDGETMCCYKYTRDTSYIGKKHSTQLKGRLTRIRNLKVDIIDTEVKLSNSKRKALTLSKKLKIALQKLIAGYGNGKVDGVVDNLEQNLKHDQDNLNNLNQQLQKQLKKCREEYVAAKQDATTSNEKNQITEQKLIEIEGLYQKKLDELQKLVDKQQEEIASHIAKITQMSDKLIQTDVGIRELSDLQDQLQKLNLERIDLINRLGDKDLKLNELDKAKKLCDESISKNREHLERLEEEIRNLDQKYRQEKAESDAVIQDLKVKLGELEDERNKLREEAKRTDDTTRLKERISELDDEVNQKRVELSALQRLNQEFENKLRICTEDKSNVEKRLADMIENYNKSLADLQRLNTTISRLETEVERLRKTPVTSDKELVELRAQRDALLLERDQLRTELKNMIDPSQHQKLEAELADKNNQIANLNREIESLRKDLQASQQLNQRVRELEASLANQSKLQQEIELLRRTIAEITKDRDENLKKLNDTLENMKALQAQLTGTDRLAIDITTVRQQLEDERRERHRLEAELTSLRSELESERLLTANLQTSNQTLQYEVGQLKTELDALKKLQLEKNVATEKDASELSHLRSQLERLEREKQDLVSEVDRLRAENTDRLSVITDLQGQLKAFEGITPQSYRDAQDQVSRLTQDNSRLTRDLSDLQLKHDRVLKDLETLRQQLVDETRKLRPSEDRIAELTSKLAELTKIKGELEAQLLTTKDSLRDSETRNSDLNQKVVDLTQENDRLNDEMRALRESVATEKKLLQDEIALLKKQLGDKSLTETEITQLRAQLKLMQDMKTQLEAKLALLETRVSELERELNQCREREAAGKDTSAQVEVLRQQLDEVSKQKESLAIELSQVREHLSQARAKNIEHEATIERLTQDKSRLAEELENLHKKFDNDNQSLRDQISTLQQQLRENESLSKTEIDRLKREIRELEQVRSDLATKIAHISNLEGRISRLESDLKICQEKESSGKDVATQVEVLSQKLAEMTRQKESLEKDWQIKHSAQEATIGQLRQENAGLVAQIGTLKSGIETERRRLTDELSDLREKLRVGDLTRQERDQLRIEKSSLETQLRELDSLRAQMNRLQGELKTCLEEKERTGRDNVQKLAQLDGQVKDLQEKLKQKLETEAHDEEVKNIERRNQEELRLQLKTAELKLEANVIGRYELTTEPPVDRVQAIGEKLGKQGITTVNGLIEAYCNYITQKLLTPAMVKISSFSLTEIREILEDEKVRLNVDKKDLARILPEYLYIDIKNVRDVNRPYYTNHFQPIQEYKIGRAHV